MRTSLDEFPDEMTYLHIAEAFDISEGAARAKVTNRTRRIKSEGAENVPDGYGLPKPFKGKSGRMVILKSDVQRHIDFEAENATSQIPHPRIIKGKQSPGDIPVGGAMKRISDESSVDADALGSMLIQTMREQNQLLRTHNADLDARIKAADSERMRLVETIEHKDILIERKDETIESLRQRMDDASNAHSARIKQVEADTYAEAERLRYKVEEAQKEANLALRAQISPPKKSLWERIMGR